MIDRAGSCAAVAESASGVAAAKEIEALHRHCGIYTKVDVVRRILNSVGWTTKVDLSAFRLLEPAAGNGAFVVEAARRLVRSCTRRRIGVTLRTVGPCIRAYELHPREASEARRRVVEALVSLGINSRSAGACAREWVVTGDFLLAELASGAFTHAVGNPPYIRWTRIPAKLKASYEARLPKELAGGDLFLPFLDRALEALKPNGRCGFICSDRWRFMAFAEEFRKKWINRLRIRSENVIRASDAFEQDVYSYPTILIASRRADQHPGPTGGKTRKKTLRELGYTVKVGPALGHTPAFVLRADERGVEARLLRPWVDGSEIKEGKITPRGRRVITVHDDDGRLIDLGRFPRVKARLARFREHLKRRSIVKNGAPWFSTIDRVRASDWNRPKVLVPELAKVPRLAIDRSGRIPAHGVYAIFAPDDNVKKLYEKLRDGKLASALKGIAPKINGGYVRCYKRFLLMVRI